MTQMLHDYKRSWSGWSWGKLRPWLAWKSWGSRSETWRSTGRWAPWSVPFVGDALRHRSKIQGTLKQNIRDLDEWNVVVSLDSLLSGMCWEQSNVRMINVPWRSAFIIILKITVENSGHMPARDETAGLLPDLHHGISQLLDSLWYDVASASQERSTGFRPGKHQCLHHARTADTPEGSQGPLRLHMVSQWVWSHPST